MPGDNTPYWHKESDSFSTVMAVPNVPGKNIIRDLSTSDSKLTEHAKLKQQIRHKFSNI